MYQFIDCCSAIGGWVSYCSIFLRLCLDDDLGMDLPREENDVYTKKSRSLKNFFHRFSFSRPQNPPMVYLDQEFGKLPNL